MGYLSDCEYIEQRRKKDKQLQRLELNLEQLVFDLVGRGVRRFVFVRWGRFEERFAYTVKLNQHKLGDVQTAIFVEEDSVRTGSPLFSTCYFDEIVYTDRLEFGLEEEQVFDHILNNCRWVVHYGILSSSIWADRLKRAGAERKKLIDLERWDLS
jgi:hypothetical protein